MCKVCVTNYLTALLLAIAIHNNYSYYSYMHDIDAIKYYVAR